MDNTLSLLLFKAVHFLQAESVALPGKAAKYAGIIKATDTRIKINGEPGPVPTGSKEIIVIDMQEATNDLLQLLDRRNTFSVIILRPHLQEELWQKAIAHEKVLLSMDCWKTGLLLRDDSFKVKQHFYLR